MKTIARKSYKQVDGNLNETDAVILQREAAGKTCLCVSTTDQPALALALTSEKVWTIPEDRNNFVGYDNIFFIDKVEGLQTGFFDLLFIDTDCYAYPEAVKQGGTIFTMSDKGLLKKERT